MGPHRGTNSTSINGRLSGLTMLSGLLLPLIELPANLGDDSRGDPEVSVRSWQFQASGE